MLFFYGSETLHETKLSRIRWFSDLSNLGHINVLILFVWSNALNGLLLKGKKYFRFLESCFFDLGWGYLIHKYMHYILCKFSIIFIIWWHRGTFNFPFGSNLMSKISTKAPRMHHIQCLICTIWFGIGQWPMGHGQQMS